MSKPRTRSQGPPDVDSSEQDQPSTAQRRMSRELMVRLETLRLLPARSSEGGETSQLQQQTATKTEASQRDPETTINDSTSIKTEQCYGHLNNKSGKY